MESVRHGSTRGPLSPAGSGARVDAICSPIASVGRDLAQCLIPPGESVSTRMVRDQRALLSDRTVFNRGGHYRGTRVFTPRLWC